MTILIIAKKGSRDLYHSFASEENKVHECTPKESLSFVNKCNPDIILLDCGFEIENGIQLVKEIKVQRPRTPIVFLTDVGSEDIVLKAFKAGVRDFFKNPVNIFELQETVEGIISLKKATREHRHPFRSIGSYPEATIFKNMTTGQPVNLIRTIRHIEENLTNMISLERLAIEANTSKYHFCRIFKKRFGISPMKFVAFMRIEKAKEFLKRGETNVSTVALEVGYNDLSSFSYQFKKFTGMTPTIYKKSLK